jgi:XTP/dITP diphosphohydrolase
LVRDLPANVNVQGAVRLTFNFITAYDAWGVQGPAREEEQEMRPLPIVLATRNAGKTEELQRLLADFPVTLKNLRDFGPIPPVEEDGATFEENAVKKARRTARVLGLPALADDSGLTVAALGGAPGVRSARYAGEHASDGDNNVMLLKELEHEENRAAAFVCVIAVAVPWGPALVYEGRCDGLVTRLQMGTEGFGYDPVFFYPPLQKTFAQLTTEEKNQVSHRGRALRELRQEFDKVLSWLRARLTEAGWQWGDS